jgi:hypothetical protein
MIAPTFYPWAEAPLRMEPPIDLAWKASRTSCTSARTFRAFGNLILDHERRAGGIVRQPHTAETNIVRLGMSSVSSLAKRTAPTMAMSRHQLVLLPRCRPARGGRGAADEFRCSVADPNPRLIGTSSPGLM